jgi:hypothetical protein
MAYWNGHLSARTAYGMPTIRSLQLSRSVDAARQAYFHSDRRSAPCHRTARCRGGGASLLWNALQRFQAPRAGIREFRHSPALCGTPLEWYLEPLGWPERNAAYLEGAGQLFVDAATKALRDAGITAAEVNTVVTISSTGIATPSLEARVASRIGFRADAESCRCSAWAAPVASRGSRLRPLGAIPARHLRVAGRGRTLHAGFPARRTDQGHANGTRVKPYAWRMHQAQLFQNIWNIPTSWLAKLTPRRDRYQAVP